MQSIENNNEEIRVNHPDDLHLITNLGSGKLTFHGYIGEHSQKRRQEHETLYKQTTFKSTAPPTPVRVALPPQLITSEACKNAFKNNDWNTIYKLQSQANTDLEPIYHQFEVNQDKSWVLVRDEVTGMWYHMSYSNKGSYCWTFSSFVDYDTDSDKNVKYSCTVQYGSYSASTKIIGIHRVWLGLAKFASEATVSGAFSYFICRLLRKGIDFLSRDLEVILTDAAADAGLDAIFTIGAYVLPIFVPCAVFAIVFIGISYLWKWLNKRFTICVSVYNFDQNNNWTIRNQSLSNAFNPGKDNATSLNLTIPKLIPPGTDPFSKLWCPNDVSSQLIHVTQYVVSYAYLVYENDHHFAQGCSFALQVGIEGSNTGVTYAFQCPWDKNNGQYMEGSIQDANSFLTKARSHWVESTSPYRVKIANGMTVEAIIDKLKGGDPDGKDTYNISIHLNK